MYLILYFSDVTKQQVIQENLSRMQQSAQKKKVAQELYYNNQGNRSPLLRANTSNYKTPVHNRLGVNKQININRKPVIKNQAGNRIKLRRTMLQPEQIIRNNIIRRRNDKQRRAQSMQNRLLRIRQNNQNQSKQIIHQNNAGQKIRLRRMRQGPVNYTVQVVNNNNKNKQTTFTQHSINSNLNAKLQEEIRLIQNKAVSNDEIPSIPIHPQGTGFTGTSLNERFSQLP